VRRAFTIVEALVVIAVVTLLMVLVVGAVRGTREAARTSACAANLRGCQQLFFLYSADYRDSWPFFARRQLADAFENGGYSLEYTLQALHWPMALRGYTGGRPLEPVQVCPYGPAAQAAFRPGGDYVMYVGGLPNGYIHTSDYWMSYSLFTDPRAWVQGGALTTPDLHPVRVSAAAFPADKGMLIEPRAYHLGGDAVGFASAISIFRPEGQGNAYNIGFIDGHGATLPVRGLVPGVSVAGVLPGETAPVLSTPGGILGVDIAH
jgi:hypothetical protein